MATAEALLRIKVLTDATQAAVGLDKASAVGGKFGSTMRKAALPAAAAGAAIVALGKKAVDAASQLQQAEGAVEAVFGTQANAVKKAAASASQTMGLSASDYENYAALVGTALQNAGFSVKDSVTESNKVMQRAADLSALYGGSTTDAVDAINAAVSRSEFDPLEKYGVSLNMTAVNAELAAKGQDKLTGAALATAKKQVILAQVYKQSGKAAGQFARESDSAAGSQAIAAAEYENAAAALGTILLPVVAAATRLLASFAKWAGKNTTLVQILAGAILAIAAAVLVVNAALKVYEATMIVVQAVQKATWLSNPIGLVVLAVIAVVAAVVLLYKKSDRFRALVDGLWRGIKAGAKAAASVLKAVFGVAFKGVTAYVKIYVTAYKLAFAVIKTVTRTVTHAVVDSFKWVRDVLRDTFNAIRDKWRDMTSAVRTAWSAATGWISDRAHGLRDSLRAAFDAVKAPVETLARLIGDVLKGALSSLAQVARGLGKILSAPFDVAKASVDKVVGAVQSLISWLGKIKFPSPPKFLSKIPGVGSVFSAPAPAARTATYAAAPTVAGRGFASGRAATSGGVTINVNGALDPENVARQIRRIVDGHERRVGLRTA